MEAHESARESRLRRLAWSQGYVLRKDRARSWNVDHHGGWMIVDANHNSIAAGARYNLSTDDVESWLAQ